MHQCCLPAYPDVTTGVFQESIPMPILAVPLCPCSFSVKRRHRSRRVRLGRSAPVYLASLGFPFPGAALDAVYTCSLHSLRHHGSHRGNWTPPALSSLRASDAVALATNRSYHHFMSCSLAGPRSQSDQKRGLSTAVHGQTVLLRGVGEGGKQVICRVAGAVSPLGGGSVATSYGWTIGALDGKVFKQHNRSPREVFNPVSPASPASSTA